MSDLRALTLWQPWAGAIACAGKDVENRTWHTAYRGELLIHAGRGRDDAARAWLDTRGVDTSTRHYQPSQIVAVARVVDCTRLQVSQWCEPDMWHWVLADVVVLKQPVPWARGEQGLWRPSLGLACGVRAQLARQGSGRLHDEVQAMGDGVQHHEHAREI